MKRMILAIAALATLAALASSCATETGNDTATQQRAGNANLAATTTPTPATADISEADLIAREKQLWDAIKRKDAAAFNGFLADDQLYVSSNGVHDKAATAKVVSELDFTELSLADFKVARLDGDAAVVTYTVTQKGTYQGKPLPPEAERHSTAWVKRGGSWQAVYHQDSVVENMPPPDASKSGTATPAASPATGASPAATNISTTADMIANEKLVWEALKSKNYDAFSSVLAEDQLEVEPGGVYDKAGSVSGVKAVDFSRSNLSDLKELKLDNDASLVTYTISAPGPSGRMETYRGTTIWVNRGGRWLAVFHQGTNVPPQKK